MRTIKTIFSDPLTACILSLIIGMAATIGLFVTFVLFTLL